MSGKEKIKRIDCLDMYYHLDRTKPTSNPFENIKDILKKGLVPGAETEKENRDILCKELCILKRYTPGKYIGSYRLIILLHQDGGILYLIDKEIKTHPEFLTRKELKKRKGVYFEGECRYEGTIKPEFIRRIIVKQDKLEELDPFKKDIMSLNIEVWTLPGNGAYAKRVL